jgi:hypothetical protein
MLEFGETSARRVISLTYAPSDDFDLTLTAYRGRVSELDEGEAWDWALGFEAWPSDVFSFGLSYQSDLADSDEQLLDDDHSIKRVPAVSGYLLGLSDNFEFSLEVVAAIDDFRQLDKELNRPVAWNAEVVYFFPESAIDLAFRIEKSRELEDAPEIVYGTAITWHIHKHIILTIEYLHGQFDTDSFAIEKEHEIAIQHVNRLGAKLTVEF